MSGGQAESMATFYAALNATPELKKDNRVAVLGINSKFKKRWKDYATRCPYKK